MSEVGGAEAEEAGNAMRSSSEDISLDLGQTRASVQTMYRSMVLSAVLDIGSFGLTILPGTQLCQAMSDGTTAGAMDVLTRTTMVMLLTAWLVSPGLGDLSDVIGRKPVLVFLRVGRLLNALAAMVTIHLAQTNQLNPNTVQVVMYTTFVLAGICEVEVTAHTYFAMVTDLYAQEQRAGQIGRLSAAMGVSVTVAQLMDGAVLDFITPIQAFGIAAVGAALSLVYTILGMHETLNRTLALRRTTRSRREVLCKVLNPVRDVILLLRDAAKKEGAPDAVPMPSLALVYFVQGFNHQLFLTTLVFYLESQYHVSTAAAAPVFTFAALLTSALMMLVRRIVERLGDVRTICMCLGVNIVGATILAFSYTFPMFILGLVPWTFHMMLVPCLSSAASRQVGPDKQGLLFGALGSIKSLALLSGAMLGGSIFAAIHRADVDVVPGAHYLMSALASAIGLLTMTRVAVLARRRGPPIALPSATVDDAQHFALLPSDAVGSSPDS